MEGVFHCSPANSTKFTTCCQVAIVESQQKCPLCRVDVYPFHEGMSDEERHEAAGGYYNHNTRMARDSYVKRNDRSGGNGR